MITLKTLHTATAQQVFDQVVNHLRKQGVKAVSNTGACRYRGNNGTKCAAGCLIGDDEYEANMECATWASLLSMKTIQSDAHHTLISSLQQVHDKSDVFQWEHLFNETAKQFDLICTPLPEQ